MKKYFALILLCLLLAMPVLAWNWMEEEEEYLLLLKSTPSTGDSLLLETDDYLLLETGDKLLLE